MQTLECNEDVSLDTFRDFLCLNGYHFRLLGGGHEQWEGVRKRRPVVLSRTVCPVPPFVIRQVLRETGIPMDALRAYLAGET
ncbi:hypothetical protein ACQKLP_22475 [Chitinophaga sp. NPDC101104]|uniref:hypothetical protein n=1 Tax=Chitinophaga sp. NPDC101104 TaxID=3390561 RepID=UPI003D063AF1